MATNIKNHSHIECRQRAAELWASRLSVRPNEAMSKVEKSLAVLLTTPHIRDYLAANDPKAMEQAQAALTGSSYLNFMN
jgi:hypothetical protein